MELKEIFEKLAEGVDPTTGEVFDLALLGEWDTYSAFKNLKAVVSEEHKKVSQKGKYRILCEEYPEHIVMIKLGYYYTAFNESAEIMGQILDYKVAYLGGRTPMTGGPDLCIIAET